MPARDHTPAELAWLLKHRAEIQNFNLVCFNFCEINSERIESGDQNILWDFFQLLVGSNFSLWRFAFLLYEDRDQQTTRQAAVSVLKYLMEDNTMSFPREVEAQSWMGGYYGNNSRYRLLRFIDKSKELNRTGQYGEVQSIPGSDEFSRRIPAYYGMYSADKLPIARAKSQEALELQFQFQSDAYGWLMEFFRRDGYEI